MAARRLTPASELLDVRVECLRDGLLPTLYVGADLRDQLLARDRAGVDAALDDEAFRPATVDAHLAEALPLALSLEHGVDVDTEGDGEKPLVKPEERVHSLSSLRRERAAEPEAER